MPGPDLVPRRVVRLGPTLVYHITGLPTDERLYFTVSARRRLRQTRRVRRGRRDALTVPPSGSENIENGPSYFLVHFDLKAFLSFTEKNAYV